MYENKIKNSLPLSSVNYPTRPTKIGFTLIEILIVISISIIFAGTAIATYHNAKKRALLDDAYASVLQAFEQTSNRAATGFGTGERQGVYLEKKGIVTFKEGDDPETLPLISISQDPSISTNQTGLTILFNRITALPDIPAGPLEITIYDEDDSDVTPKTITITEDGRIISQ